MKNNRSGIFPQTISKEQAKDSGMALVLILLIIGLLIENNIFYFLAAAFLLVNMTIPVLFRPFAFVWLGFSTLLGAITSKILLLLIYFVVVLPVALARRLLGKDSLSLGKFKKGDGSAFVCRDHVYQAEDLERPF
jgi:hypothetical protein